VNLLVSPLLFGQSEWWIQSSPETRFKEPNADWSWLGNVNFEGVFRKRILLCDSKADFPIPLKLHFVASAIQKEADCLLSPGWSVHPISLRAILLDERNLKFQNLLGDWVVLSKRDGEHFTGSGFTGINLDSGMLKCSNQYYSIFFQKGLVHHVSFDGVKTDALWAYDDLNRPQAVFHGDGHQLYSVSYVSNRISKVSQLTGTKQVFHFDYRPSPVNLDEVWFSGIPGAVGIEHLFSEDKETITSTFSFTHSGNTTFTFNYGSGKLTKFGDLSIRFKSDKGRYTYQELLNGRIFREINWQPYANRLEISAGQAKQLFLYHPSTNKKVLRLHEFNKHKLYSSSIDSSGRLIRQTLGDGPNRRELRISYEPDKSLKKWCLGASGELSFHHFDKQGFLTQATYTPKPISFRIDRGKLIIQN